MIYLAVRQKIGGYAGQQMQNVADRDALHIFQDLAAFRAFVDGKNFSGCPVMVFDDTGEAAPVPVNHTQS